MRNLSKSQFIGRGEEETIEILKLIFPNCTINAQVPIVKMIRSQDYAILDQEIKNHKFDIVAIIKSSTLVIEVNFKHKEKAAKKWSNIFTRLLINNGKIPITIEDYNCEYLFSDSERLLKKNPWGSTIDIIRELDRQGIDPDGSLSKMQKNISSS